MIVGRDLDRVTFASKVNEFERANIGAEIVLFFYDHAFDGKPT